MSETHPNTPQFPLRDVVRLVLAEQGVSGWTVQDDAFWCLIDPPDQPHRVQGWKLHISATVLSAPQVLYLVARVLVAYGCQFKFIGHMDGVRELTSGRAERSQCGKFITAYPQDDDQFRLLAAELDRVTAGLPGPAVLSDRPYRKGGLVHYRYGAFAGVPVLTSDGKLTVYLSGPAGEPVPDLRTPWFSVPPWADPPFADPPSARLRGRGNGVAPASVLLHGRYLVHEAIQHSARGGVYRATDRETDAAVIVKQARAHVDTTIDGLDARAVLRREAATLDALSGWGPDVVEVFDQEDHVFLVESTIAGTVLGTWVAQRLADVGFDGGIPVADAVTVARGLGELLAGVHERGFVFRDLSPNNVMVGPDLTVRLIDPELAVRHGEWSNRGFTPGYGAPEYVAGDWYGPAPAAAVDRFSLGAVLFYLATGSHPGLAQDEPHPAPPTDRLGRVLTAVAGHNAAARALAPAVLGLCAADPEDRWSLARLAEHLAEPTGAGQHDTGPHDTGPHDTGPLDAARTGRRAAPIDRMIDDGLAEILATMPDVMDGPVNGGPIDRLWRSGGFGSGTDPCNVQHGAAGVLSVLTRASRVLDRAELQDAVRRVAAWIDARREAIPRILPGLHFGRAGTAWALFDAAGHLADPALADGARRLALALPVRWQNPDLFHGAAGAGMTQVHLWSVTQQTEFLDRIVECADGLLAAATTTDDGLIWRVPTDLDSVLAGASHLGYAHGVAGIGMFLLAAAQATGRKEYRHAALAAANTLVAAAETGPWGARWRTDHADRPGEGLLYHLCSGAAGVGTFLLRVWRETGDETALALARGAGEAVYRSRWIAGTSMCHGLAGNGGLLLDLAADLGEPYRRWAHAMAECLYATHVARRGRVLVPDESGATVCMDYGIGLAGVVDFLLRLRYGGPRPWQADTVPAAVAVGAR